MNTPSLAKGVDGEMTFCESCPAASQCCTRLGPTRSLPSPFVFDAERPRLEALGGVSSASTSVGEPIWRLSTSDTGCVFNKHGRCTIYADRPLDCRLFPFDIHERADGVLVWVVYTNLCPDVSQVREYFAGVKELFNSYAPTLPEVTRFARYGRTQIYSQPSIELESVDTRSLAERRVITSR